MEMTSRLSAAMPVLSSGRASGAFDERRSSPIYSIEGAWCQRIGCGPGSSGMVGAKRVIHGSNKKARTMRAFLPGWPTGV
jgi:hypothetical protein